MKKKCCLLFLFSILLCSALFADPINSFVVKPLLLPDDNIAIMTGTVTFSGEKITVDYKLKDNIKKKMSKSLDIDCYPSNSNKKHFFIITHSS